MNMISTTTTTTTYPAVQQETYYVAPVEDGKARTVRIRVCIITFSVLISISCVASFVSWLILRHAHNPDFRVERFAVTAFNVTNPQKFAAVWGANVVAENPNGKFKVYIDLVECNVYYKDEFLASSSLVVGPVYLPKKGRESMEVEMKAHNIGQPSVGWWVVDEMGKGRNGSGNWAVSFNLRMSAVATFKAGIGRSKRASLKVNCEGLNISFVGNGDSGVFAPRESEAKQCLVEDV